MNHHRAMHATSQRTAHDTGATRHKIPVRATAGRECGATLLVSLVMLIVLTLLVVSSIRTGTTHLKISGNMQVQTEANAAAQQAVETVLGTNFMAAPAAVNMTVSIGSDYAVAVAQPECIATAPVLPTELDATNAADKPCFGEGEAYAVIDPNGNQVTPDALCTRQNWEVAATARNTDTGVNATTVQGVEMRAGRTSGC